MIEGGSCTRQRAQAGLSFTEAACARASLVPSIVLVSGVVPADPGSGLGKFGLLTAALTPEDPRAQVLVLQGSQASPQSERVAAQACGRHRIIISGELGSEGIDQVRTESILGEPVVKRLVFVSHSGMDTWVAKQIAREISDCGATPFLDEAQIDVGFDFEDDILTFLDKAHELVVLLTPWALERPYVWAELGAAWGRRIPIIGLLHGLTAAELQSRQEVPILIKRRDLLPLNEIGLYAAQLRERVENHSRTRPEVKE